MPANLTPQYYEAEEAFKNAKTKEEKIAALEEMLAVIPKHKGTDKLQANLRKKLSQIKKQDESKGGEVQDDPYLVEKQGAGQAVLLGFPNTGKSSIIKTLTNAKVEVANYPFTTNLPVPAMMSYEDIKIQLVDTPPLTRDGIPGPFMTTILNAELLLLIIDLSSDKCIDQLQDLIELLKERRIIRDKVPEGVRAFSSDKYHIIATKSDVEGSKENLKIIKELIPEISEIMPLSVENGENLNKFKELLFNKLEIIRIYTKAPGKDPDLEKPFTLKKGATVFDFAQKIHRDIAKNLKKARVWGSARFDGQPVSKDYLLADGDIVELHEKSRGD